MRPAVIAFAAVVALVAAAPAATAAESGAVAVMPASADATRSIPVRGTKLQRRIARHWLARLGSGTAVRALAFRFVERRGPMLRIRLDPAAAHPSGGLLPVAWWHAELLGNAIVRDVRDRGGWLVGVEIRAGKRSDGGSSFVPRAARRAPTATALAAEANARALRSGLAVTGTARPLRPAALELHVTLREQDLFATPEGWNIDALMPPRYYGDRRRYDLFLEILAPDGRALYTVAQTASAGMSGSGPDMDGPVPSDPPPPELLSGESSLTIEFSVPDYETSQPSTATVTLTCGAEPAGVPDAAAACDRMLRDRWALFGQYEGCIGGLFPTVTVTGTVAGRPAVRSYGRCGSSAVRRWADTLGVTLP